MVGIAKWRRWSYIMIMAKVKIDVQDTAITGFEYQKITTKAMKHTATTGFKHQNHERGGVI